MTQGWQEMSTARRMLGDVVDLWVVDKTIKPNGSVTARGRRVANAKWSSHGDCGRSIAPRWTADGDDVEVVISCGRTIATHWRPLPVAPEQEG